MEKKKNENFVVFSFRFVQRTYAYITLFIFGKRKCRLLDEVQTKSPSKTHTNEYCVMFERKQFNRREKNTHTKNACECDEAANRVRERDGNCMCHRQHTNGKCVFKLGWLKDTPKNRTLHKNNNSKNLASLYVHMARLIYIQCCQPKDTQFLRTAFKPMCMRFCSLCIRGSFSAQGTQAREAFTIARNCREKGRPTTLTTWFFFCLSLPLNLTLCRFHSAMYRSI